MKEFLTINILEEYIPLVFPELKVDGARFARRIYLERGEPILDKIAELDRDIHTRTGCRLFYGFDIIRHYTDNEINASDYFYLRFKASSYFDPAGEECGTRYEDQSSCRECGAGGRQVGPLYLKSGSIPKRTDIAATIAGEIVVSERFADLIKAHDISGVALAPVFEVGKGGVTEADWYQWSPSPPLFDIVAPTKVGDSLFDEKIASCSRGDTLGANLLSEVFLTAPSKMEVDVMWSRQFIGRRIGLLRPRQVMVVSKNLMRLMSDFDVKGHIIEVAHTT